MASMSRSFEDFVPDLGRAHGHVSERVVDSERWLLVGVSGRAVVRRTWVDACEISEALHRELVAQPEPVADLDAATPRTHRLLEPASRAAQPGRCGACWVDRLCQGTDRLPCSTCDGTGRAVPVRLAFAEDVVTPLAHVFVPEAARELWLPLARFLRQRSSLPECLAFQLADEQTRVDAYRGRRGREEYRGHALGQAVVRARHYVERLRRAPSIVALEHRAHVWPFALVELEETRPGFLRVRRRLGLVVDEHGAEHVIHPDAGPA